MFFCGKMLAARITLTKSKRRCLSLSVAGKMIEQQISVGWYPFQYRFVLTSFFGIRTDLITKSCVFVCRHRTLWARFWLGKAVRHPDSVQKLAAMGIDPVGSTPAEYAKQLRADIELFVQAVRASGVKAE